MILSSKNVIIELKEKVLNVERCMMRSSDYSKLSKMSWDNEILLLCSKIHECKGRQDLFVRQNQHSLNV